MPLIIYDFDDMFAVHKSYYLLLARLDQADLVHLQIVALNEMVLIRVYIDYGFRHQKLNQNQYLKKTIILYFKNTKCY